MKYISASRRTALLILASSFAAACSAPQSGGTPVATAPSPPRLSALPTVPACVTLPVVAPTPLPIIPGYLEVDPSTGLHVTGNMQVIDLQSYRLKVTGMVDRPLSLTFDELRCLPKIQAEPRLVCPGFFEDLTTWAGVPIRDVLALAGVQDTATSVSFVSVDDYSAEVSLNSARAEDAFLAYEWKGQPLPLLHGFPVRAVLPQEAGGVWIKWLVEIEVQ